jgi:hypothetical protein
VADENDFDDLKLSGNDGDETADEAAADFDFAPFDETTADAVDVEAVAEDLDAVAETAESGAVEAVDLETLDGTAAEHQPDLDEEEEEKEPSKLPVLLEVLAVVGVPVVLVGLYFYGKMEYWTAGYAMAMTFIPYVLWKGRLTSTVFTVFLGCVLAAELTAIYVLFVELSRYNFDMKGRAGKQQRVAVVQPIERDLVPHFGGTTKLLT